MDRHLQERLVGAIVLVIIAVLVIPEFLSGPRKRESITQGLELPAEGESELKTVTIQLDRSTDTPQSPVAKTSTAETTSTPPKPSSKTVLSGESEKRSAEGTTRSTSSTVDAAKTGASSKSGFAVQVGSFSQQGNAQRLANTLRQQGYAVTVSEHKSRGRTLHRVRVGPMKTRAEADTMAARLSREGQQAAVVPLQ